MAQLSIPQSLIGALIDIADMGELEYFPPSQRCTHWALYDAQRQELLCPCAPAATSRVEKLFESAAKILYANFPRHVEAPDQIIPYTSRQELLSALLREAQEAEATSAPSNSPDSNADAEETLNSVVSPGKAQSTDKESNKADKPEAKASPAPQKPSTTPLAPSPALFARQTVATAPAQAVPTPATAGQAGSLQDIKQETAQEATVRPAPGAPSPGMFRKATLTYRPPQIEKYLEGLRARQHEEQVHDDHTENIATEDTAERPTEVTAAIPAPSVTAPAVPVAAAPIPSAAPDPSHQPSPETGTPADVIPSEVTPTERERVYRIRHSLRQRLEQENIDEELVRTIQRLGRAERLNDWTIRFTHDDYRMDVNIASGEVITVIDEYDAAYNEAVPSTLSRDQYTPLNALELAYSERARTFLTKNPEFVFDLMVRVLSAPESVRLAAGWTRIYTGEGLDITVSPDERTVLSLAKNQTFQSLHAEALRQAQIDELSHMLSRQAAEQNTASSQPAEQGTDRAENEQQYLHLREEN